MSTATHAQITTDALRTGKPADRAIIRAACDRMAPDTARLTALTQQLIAVVQRPDYLPGYATSLEKAINTISLIHAVDCDKPGCRTCAAIRIALTATAAHHLATDGDRP